MPGTLTRSRATLDWISPLSALAALESEPYTLLMHGGGAGERGRFSYLCAFPGFTVEGRDAASAFARARSRFARVDHARAGFQGGYAGLFGYELAAAFERVPTVADGLGAWPAMALGWYEAVLVFDHSTRSLTIVGNASAADRLAERVRAARHDERLSTPGRGRLQPVWSETRYLEAAERARAYVQAGDVFQVNLSHPFQGRIEGEYAPLSVFARLAADSPAAFSAFFRLDRDRVIVTNSPERFVQLYPDGRVQTRPIKGTRPRGKTPAEDLRLAADLLASSKDRAENLMIVDLMRNDLARVCRPGTIQVPELFAVEGFSNVHHLVSTVEGRLREDLDVFDLIAASFPPGSITGAPKLRAMEIIAELEGVARGPYCGALGWIDASGGCDLNVMIRTAAFVRDGSGWVMEARSGGAITIDSDAPTELAETHSKLAALKAAVEGHP